ncbi:MAG: hypothetical protein KAR20_02955 [Candidatus Heimdallarchaeota archaeon]|nr:hypothetical protein [Candidatus Heimdallarchaeota archaeon]
MISTLIAYAITGKLLMYFLRKFPTTNIIAKKLHLTTLIECNLCLGFWVYLILVLFFKVNIFSIYYPGVSEIATAALMSFVMWLLTIGWFDEFGIIEVELDADRESSSESR